MAGHLRQMHWIGGGSGHAGDVVEDVENALCAGGALGRRNDAAHGVEPGVEAPDVGEEGGEHADRDLVLEICQMPKAQTTTGRPR